MGAYGVTLELSELPTLTARSEPAQLRPLLLSDAARIVEMAGDDDVQTWANMPADMTVAMAERHVTQSRSNAQQGSDLRWAISATDTHDLLAGSIQLAPQPHVAHAMIGYEMHPDSRGQGLCTSAVRQACQWWFDVGGVRVYWTALVGNDASWRVAQKCGFELHAVLPDYLPDQHGQPAAAWMASLAAPHTQATTLSYPR